MGDRWSAADYARNARFVSDLGGPVVALLAPVAGEDILDLGCGDGALTESLVASGARVVGVDASKSMVAAARVRGLDARVMDATGLAFSHAFDAVFTNAALHWVPRAGAVVEGVARALRPGGRFVGEFGGFGNVAAIRVALDAALRIRGVGDAAPIPWYFPTPAEYGAVLTSAGFTVDTIELIPRPTPLPTGMEGWLKTLAAPVLAPLPDDERAAVQALAIDLLAPALRDDAGNWIADYTRIRFRASKR